MPAWQEPKTDWESTQQGVSDADFNRIEVNTKFVYDMQPCSASRTDVGATDNVVNETTIAFDHLFIPSGYEAYIVNGYMGVLPSGTAQPDDYEVKFRLYNVDQPENEQFYNPSTGDLSVRIIDGVEHYLAGGTGEKPPFYINDTAFNVSASLTVNTQVTVEAPDELFSLVALDVHLNVGVRPIS